MLEYLRTGPPSPEQGSPLLVLLHGRGSHMGDLQSLVRVVPAGGTLVTPQAPHPGAPWGYGSGWAWYRYLGEDRADSRSLSYSLLALEEFLGALPEKLGFQPGPLVLGGFSQGGTTSLAYAMTHPGHLSGVVNLSGFLVDPGSMADPSRGRPVARGGTNRREAAGEAPEGSAAPGLEGPGLLPGIPVFWGHGTEDPAVPFPLAVDGRRRLHEAGVRLEAQDYRMGHQVSAEGLDHLGIWLRGTIPGWA